MKRFFLASFVLLSLLAITTGSVFADGVVKDMKVSRSGGLTFTFTVTGFLSPSQLSGGYVRVQGGDVFDLHCTQTDEFTVVCHAPAKINGGVTVGLGGSTFWVEKGDMPEPKAGKGTLYCYGVWDVPTMAQFDEGIDEWVKQGEYCQESPASQFDEIQFYSPYYKALEYYWFLEEGGDFWFDVNPGPGYYWWN